MEIANNLHDAAGAPIIWTPFSQECSRIRRMLRPWADVHVPREHDFRWCDRHRPHLIDNFDRLSDQLQAEAARLNLVAYSATIEEFPVTWVTAHMPIGDHFEFSPFLL